MLDEYFKFLNQGRSAAVAVIIFICVIPIILLNVFTNNAENTISIEIIKNGMTNQ